MKHINKIPLRKLVHKRASYLWKRGHYHLEKYERSKCAEKLIIYLKDYKNAPLHLHFREEDNLLMNLEGAQKKWQVGYPDAGVVWYAPPVDKPTAGLRPEGYMELNLNHPKTMVKLIDYFLQNGWKPTTDRQAFVVENALCKIDEFI